MSGVSLRISNNNKLIKLCVTAYVFFVFQVVRGVSGGARGLRHAGVGGVSEHADGGARPAGAGPPQLSPAV